MSSSNKPTRRDFLKATSSAALAAAAPATNLQAQSHAAQDTPVRFSPAQLVEAGPQRTYSGDRTTQIAIPIGGIGAGSVCMNGYGGLQDFSIREHPETTALPSTFSANSPEAAFATIRIKGSSGVTKMVEGPFPCLQDLRPGPAGARLAPGRL